MRMKLAVDDLADHAFGKLLDALVGAACVRGVGHVSLPIHADGTTGSGKQSTQLAREVLAPGIQGMV